MDIRHIKYLVLAIERKSLSGAARDLGVSVQAASKSISELEREVGGKLLVRDKQGARPTKLGMTFYRSALPVLDAMASLEKTMGLRANEDKLRLVLAVPRFEKCERICYNIESVLSRMVGIDATVVVGDGPRALTVMNAGLVDGIISIGEVHDDDLVCLPCLSAQPAVNFSREHPLASKDYVTIEELSNYPVSRDPGIDSFGEPIIDHYLARGLRSPVHIVHGEDEFNAFIAAEAGYCFSIYTPHGEALFPTTHIRPLAPSDSYKLPLCLVGPTREKQSANFVKLYSFLASNMLLAPKTIQTVTDAG